MTKAELVEKMAKDAGQTMDFEKAERERLKRDGSLSDIYRLDTPDKLGNLYIMPSGKLISADEILYNQNVIFEHPEDILI